MGLAILLFARSCCRLLWKRWLHPLHLLGPVLLEPRSNQQTNKTTMEANFYFFFSLHILFTTVLSQWDFSHGKFGLLSPGKAGCDSHATQPTVHARCFSVSIIHQTLTWTTRSLMCAQILMHAVAHGGYMDTHKRVCTESWLWEKNPLLHQGIEPASAACWSHALPTELHPCCNNFCFLSLL